MASIFDSQFNVGGNFTAAMDDYGIGQQAMHKPCGWKNGG